MTLLDFTLEFLNEIDFERRDDDELGFRKNDIITVINCKDEHCWIGDLNGLRLENESTKSQGYCFCTHW